MAIHVFGWYADYLNLKNLNARGLNIPPEFAGLMDPDFLERARDYTSVNTRFSVLASIFNFIMILIFFFAGPLKYYGAFIDSLGLPFIPSGILFFLILFYAETLLSIPFSLFRTFVIEKRFSFSTTTAGLWAADLVKSLIISTVLTVSVTAAALWLVENSPGSWWLLVWVFFFIFSVFMIYVSPYVIEPLFNKFDPVDDAGLRERIEEMMKRVGLRVKSVLKTDASRRTRHTNAYFTGIGGAKRIVLYDTLLEKLSGAEILAVLAHEIGHWKKRHLLKGLIVTEAMALAALYVSFRLLNGDFLSALFNLGGPGGAFFFAKVAAIGLLGSIAGFFSGPAALYFSRRREFESDRYSLDLTNSPDGLTGALIKLSRDNLSNPYPHPLFVALNYSHPPVLQRIRRLKTLAEK